MIPKRREGDPDEADYSTTRNGFAWTLPFNLGTVAGKGWLSIVALMLIGGMMSAGALVYVNYRAFEAVASDHKTMMKADDRLACIITLTPEERTKFRLDGGSWARWCPWLMGINGQ